MKSFKSLVPASLNAFNPSLFAAFRSVTLTDDRLMAQITGEAASEQWTVRLGDSGLCHISWQNGLDAYEILTRDLQESPWKSLPLQLSETADGWELRGQTTQIHIIRTGAIAVSSPQGVFHFRNFLRKNHSLRCSMDSPEEEHLYGLGEKVGRLDKKGRFWTQWTTDAVPHEEQTDPLYQAIPFAMLGQPSGFRGVFLANSARTYFDATDPGQLWVGSDDGPLSLYAIPGPSAASVLERYTSLTGRTPLPPLYALGFQQSRYSYMDQHEVLQVAQSFQEHRLPLDVIYLDIDYMDGYRVFTFNPKTFADPEELAESLKVMGISLVTIIDPGVKVDPQYAVYQQGERQHLFVEYANGEEFHARVWPGVCAFPDFAQSSTRQWWANLHQALLDTGVQGIWNDMNEPAMWGEGTEGSAGHPEEEQGIVHHTTSGVELPHSLVHNLYALLEAHATYKGLAAQRPRPFILSRSGFSGIQRYAAVWTGDNSSLWEHLAMAIPMCLNLGLSGIPMVGPDIAGFLDNASAELYARWLQMGVFFPFVRAHSAIGTARHEPWSFGQETLNIARRYIEYRYRLLPYWYSLFREAQVTGSPMMRPMFWTDASEDAFTTDDQFMVGDSLLIAPVIEEGARSRLVTLPAGRWYDPWSGEWSTGGQRIKVEAPLDHLPLFMKGGAIIPLAPLVQSTAQWMDTSPWPETLWVLPGHGTFNFYADDGHSAAYQQGHYLDIQFCVDQTEESLQIEWRHRHVDSALSMINRPIVLKVGPFGRPRKEVLGDGESLIRPEKHPHFVYITIHLQAAQGSVTIR